MFFTCAGGMQLSLAVAAILTYCPSLLLLLALLSYAEHVLTLMGGYGAHDTRLFQDVSDPRLLFRVAQLRIAH